MYSLPYEVSPDIGGATLEGSRQNLISDIEKATSTSKGYMYVLKSLGFGLGVDSKVKKTSINA